LLGVIGHELRALAPDTVDVGRLADHESLMVDGGLHPADVVAHDEQDIRLPGRRLRKRQSRHRKYHHSNHGNKGARNTTHATPPINGLHVPSPFRRAGWRK
jgi:hypothetical protein